MNNQCSHHPDPFYVLAEQSHELMGLVMIGQDITEQKQTQVALRESQTLFQSFMNNIPATAYIKDGAGKYLSVNQLAEEIFGYTNAEVMGKTDFDLLPSEIVEQWWSHDQIVFETGQPLRQIETFYLPDGGYAYVSLKFMIQDTRGRKLLAGTSLDSTDRLRVEAALSSSEDCYQSLADSIPQLIWTTNAAGDLLDVNQRWLNFTGLPLEQAKTLGWPAVLHPDDIPRPSEAWSAAQKQSTTYRAEGRMPRADGPLQPHSGTERRDEHA